MSDASIVGFTVTVYLASTPSTTTVAGYSPLFKLMFSDAVPFSSVVLLYVTPFIVVIRIIEENPFLKENMAKSSFL